MNTENYFLWILYKQFDSGKVFGMEKRPRLKSLSIVGNPQELKVHLKALRKKPEDSESNTATPVFQGEGFLQENHHNFYEGR